MTFKQAVDILIYHACQDCVGTGTGIRSVPSYDEKEKVLQAVAIVFKKAKGRLPDDNELFNWGILR